MIVIDIDTGIVIDIIITTTITTTAIYIYTNTITYLYYRYYHYYCYCYYHYHYHCNQKTPPPRRLRNTCQTRQGRWRGRKGGYRKGVTATGSKRGEASVGNIVGHVGHC